MDPISLLIGAIVAAASAYGGISQLLDIFRPQRRERPATLEARLEALATSLAEAGRAATAVEAEIRARELAVENLRTRSEQYEELAKLSQQEAKAVEATLDRVVRRDRSRTFLLNTLVGFGLGVGTSLLANSIWVGVLHH